LISTGAAVRDESGKLVPADVHLKAPDDVCSDAVRAYHKSCLKLGTEILDTGRIEDRQFCSVNMMVTEETFRAIQERIKEFRDEIALTDVSESSNARIAQMNIQFFKVND
jgi:uncharacterized protein (TIGR02147 family)